MSEKLTIDCLYINGDSWVYGSELVDPSRPDLQDHFHPIHENYRKKYKWPTLIAEQIGAELINNSEPGSGNDRILRTSIYDLAQLKMQGRRVMAIVAWSQLHRFEVSNRGGPSFRGFVNPNDPELPKGVREFWGTWSSDYCDLVKWITQMISFHSFCRANDIPVLGLSVFKKPYNLLERYISSKEFKPYLTQLNEICDLPAQHYQFSLESILKQYTGIDYGPGGHPLKKGHMILARNIENKLKQRFTINQPEAPNQLHS